MATLFAHWPMGSSDAYPNLINDVAGSYGLTVTPGAGGFPKQVAFPNLAPSYAREWSRANENVVSGNVLTDHWAEAEVTPATYAALVDGDWSCAFWFRRRPKDAGESNSAGTILALSGADENLEGGLVSAVRYLNDSQGGIFQMRWNNYDGSARIGVTAAFPSFNPVIGRWYHVVAKKSMEGSTYRGHLFVDGRVVNAVAASLGLNSNAGAYLPSAARISMGATRNWIETLGTVVSQPLNGVLYDVRLYSGALTSSEVATLFRESTTPWAYKRNVPHGV